MTTLRAVGVLSATKLSTALMATVGLAAGAVYSFGGALIDSLVSIGWITSTETPGLSIGTALAFFALIGMPMIGAVIGLFSGVIGAALFNMVAGWVGGIEIRLEQ